MQQVLGPSQHSVVATVTLTPEEESGSSDVTFDPGVVAEGGEKELALRSAVKSSLARGQPVCRPLGGPHCAGVSLQVLCWGCLCRPWLSGYRNWPGRRTRPFLYCAAVWHKPSTRQAPQLSASVCTCHGRHLSQQDRVSVLPPAGTARVRGQTAGATRSA